MRPCPAHRHRKGPGAPRLPPPSHGARTNSQDANSAGGNERRDRHRLQGWGRVGTIAINAGVFGHALRYPVMVPPAFNVLVGIDGPEPHF